MTESEWLACTDPQPMLSFLRSKASERKLRLFAVACCQRMAYLLPFVEKSLRIAEQYAEGLVDHETLVHARHGCRPRCTGGVVSLWLLGEEMLDSTAYILTVESSLQTAAAALISCIFGNPYRPVSINPAWLTPPVVLLAYAACEKRALPSGELDTARLRAQPSGELDTERLSVLADALEEAGCDNADILSHLRGPGPHIRGCWVLDLLLGKE